MRRTWSAAPLALALLLAAMSTAAAPDSSPDADELRDQLLGLGQQFVPKADPTLAQLQGDEALPANPWLSLLPSDELEEVDWAFWRDYAELKAGLVGVVPQRGDDARLAATELLVDEQEPDGVRGGNDTLETAEFVPGLGTGSDDTGQARILGTLSEPRTAPAVASTEDDGAIGLANEPQLLAGGVVRTSGTIGDGPFGETSGDADHFSLGTLAAGRTVLMDIDANATSGLDSTLTVYDADGNAVAFNDDGDSLDSLLSFDVPVTGTYTVAVAGFGFFQEDPFDSASGSGAGSTGAYDLSIGLDASDVDGFSVDLEPGDVLSAIVEDAGTQLDVLDPDGRKVIGSGQDASFLYPANTPLLGGGNALVDHVSVDGGRHTIQVTGATGNYEATVRVLRPGFDQRNRRQQVFLDFDGEEVNTAIFGGPGVRDLSPLSAFLGRWGLGADDEDAVVDAIVANVRENLRRDLRRSGLDGDVRISIRNSRDHADRFGRRNVSRVIVGGTIAESGVATIGIAQSIDPGNYGGEESALVLLDILSDPPTGEFGSPSLNDYLTDESDTVAFVGEAIGNVVSHEIGHYLGNWHVDQFNDVTNLMDQGGNFPLLYGVGPDEVGGTGDDLDIDFGVDEFNPLEGFTGLEDTRARAFWGLVR